MTPIPVGAGAPPPGPRPVHGFELARLLAEWQRQGKPYLEFLRRESMSLGLYVLPAGGEDKQQPHGEDEVYVVLAGKAVLRVADGEVPVAAGSVVFVAKGVPHRFERIEEDLATLVVFAPPEGTA